MDPGSIMNVGIIGCGDIIAAYLATFPRLDAVRLVAVADLDHSRAEAVAAGQEGVRALTVDELLADPDIDLVLNLTIPAAHAAVALKAIAAGKSVYGEKPLAASTDQAREVLQAAAAANVVVGCAPDTVLGTGTQTARKAIDDGVLPRANGQLAFHMLDVMESLLASTHTGASVVVRSGCERPSGVPLTALGTGPRTAGPRAAGPGTAVAQAASS